VGNSSYQHAGALTSRAVLLLYQAVALIHFASIGLFRRAQRLLEPFLAYVPWSCRFGAVSTLCAVLCIRLGRMGVSGAAAFAGLSAEHLDILQETWIPSSFERLCLLAFVFGWFQLVAAFAAFVRRRYSLLVLKVAQSGFAVLWAWLLVFIVRVPGILYHADAQVFDKISRNDFWLGGTGAWLPVMLVSAVTLVALSCRAVWRFYARSAAVGPLFGDRIVRQLRPDRGDKRFRSSYYWSAFLHVFVLFIVPALIRGCAEAPYGIPAGSGEPLVQVVRVKKIKKKKKDKVVLNLNSAILFYRPDLDDIKVIEEVEDETLDTYEATSLQTGQPGKGGGRGGWPGGMADAKVRFIRLEYSGGDWDQQMGKGADYNFLIQFKKLTGFNIAANTEHLPIRQLRRFPEHRAPPFVFITGSGNINVSGQDIKTLRWYLIEEGGMVFADNGGGSFNASFRRLMQRVLPELEWVDIASDDIIFRQPYLFPGGAPPLWHHSGYRALGLKHNGRWVVFYHQGDLNDAWQTGHSGVSENQAAQAYKLGVNVVNYAFNQYWNLHYR
jgi:hypothetical protein